MGKVSDVFREAFRQAGKSRIVKLHRKIAAEDDRKAGIVRKICQKCKGTGHLILKRKKRA